MKNRACSAHVKTTDHALCPNNDDEDVPLWPSGTEVKMICSWVVFLRYWRDKFPHLTIRKKGANTCTDCLILTNEFRTRSGRAKARDER